MSAQPTMRALLCRLLNHRLSRPYDTDAGRVAWCDRCGLEMPATPIRITATGPATQAAIDGSVPVTAGPVVRGARARAVSIRDRALARLERARTRHPPAG